MRKILLLGLLIFSYSSYAQKQIVYVPIEPIAYLASEIAGEHFQVETLIGKGKDPHTYSPTPRQIKKLSKAAGYLSIKAPFEKVIEKKIAQVKSIQLFDLTKNIEFREKESNHDHSGHKHNHGDHHPKKDPHIWLGPNNLKVLSQNIYKALTQLSPDKEKVFSKNKMMLIERINKIDNEIKKILKPFAGKSVFVFHSAFGYFLDHYTLKQVAIEHDNKATTPKQLKHLILHAKENNAQALFVQPQFDKKSAKTIAKAIDAQVVTINALKKDVLSNLTYMAKAIAGVLEK